MRIDGLIFDKKYVSKLDFEGDTLYLYRKGDCCAYKYKMKEEKSVAQIAEYLLELNTCDDQQVDMTTDDHSKLINLDIEGQHPIAAINELPEKLEEINTHLEELDEKVEEPIKLDEYTFETLPDVEESKGRLVYVTDRECIAYCDGVNWKKILLDTLE